MWTNCVRESKKGETDEYGRRKTKFEQCVFKEFNNKSFL